MSEIVVPEEMAKELGVSGRRFRGWLRAQLAAGNPLVGAHERNARWEFDPATAAKLMKAFRGSARPRPADPPRARQRREASVKEYRSGHRAIEEWMGERVETLADLLGPGLSGVVIGINPSPVSVAAGHYYQGRVGQTFFARLEASGVLPPGDGYEDDRAFAAGLGFTDVVKRPTARADGLRSGELQFGRHTLEEKLAGLEVKKVIFTFKKSAVALLGPFEGHGLRPGRPLAGAQVFVMPGPMERSDRVDVALAKLRAWWE